MNDVNAFYPANPLHVPASATGASPAFRAEVKKTLATIIFFFVVYFILIALSIVLSVICIALGIGLVSFLANFIGLVAGLGIISIGIMVFVFLVKFIFSVKKFDTSNSLEINAAEQPLLFDFIKKLTEDTHTQFPKKIVLSADVNACVFYNDSFWSMIFPVKKNLQIGLGLVNTLTISEFKAVMAHEFGHFSQTSMKLGSFVYNVNKVIYNILFENKNYGTFLQRWGNLHWAIYIFVAITVQLVKGIQFILQKMYGLINKSYMSLSREMEFHADAVAASVSGSENLITALRKVEISDNCFNTVMQKADGWLKEKKIFQNVYAKHNVVMIQYAREFDLPLQNNTPVSTNEFYKRTQQSRINIKNQWASHPTREDRETHLQQLGIDAVADNRPAWLLFTNAVELQQQVTSSLYKEIAAENKQEIISEETFKERFLTEADAYHFPGEYNGYFDDHLLNDMDFDKLAAEPAVELTAAAFDALFNEEKIGLLKSIKANEGDIKILEAIAGNDTGIKTFDYDGEKYKARQAPAILEKLQKELIEQNNRLQQQDENIVQFFYSAAQQHGSEARQELITRHHLYAANKKKTDEYSAACQQVFVLLSPLNGGGQVNLQEATDMASGLRKESNTMRPLLLEWYDKGAFDNNNQLKQKVTQFCSAQFHYFSGDSFFDNELKLLHELVIGTINELATFQFRQFKVILELQLKLYNKTAGIEKIHG